MQWKLKRLVVAALLGIALAIGLTGHSFERAQQTPTTYVAGDPGGGGGTGG